MSRSSATMYGRVGLRFIPDHFDNITNDREPESIEKPTILKMAWSGYSRVHGFGLTKWDWAPSVARDPHSKLWRITYLLQLSNTIIGRSSWVIKQSAILSLLAYPTSDFQQYFSISSIHLTWSLLKFPPLSDQRTVLFPSRTLVVW